MFCSAKAAVFARPSVNSDERALDITDAVIAQLNKKIGLLKVDFAPVPRAGPKP